MKIYKKIVLLLFIILFALPGCIGKNNIDKNIAKYFKEYDVIGSFELYDLKNNKYIRYNSGRCKEGFLPASTFKICNALIGLESGVIKDENFVIKWDGHKHQFKQWNQDHNLRTAMKNSVVWYFQELARRVGEKKMNEYLEKADYGNKDISAGIDVFWLEGNFKINQEQQIEFLKKLYHNQLPFSKKSMEIVKSIMLQEVTDKYKLYAKTGYSYRQEPHIGWWVGFVETKDNVYFFAMNLERRDMNKNFTKTRIILTKKILTDLNIYSGPITNENNW